MLLTRPGRRREGPIKLIRVAGTEPLPGKLVAATVTVTSTKPRGGTGDRFVKIGGVTGGTLKSFTAAKSDLVGDRFNMTGFVGAVTLRDVLNRADII